MLKRCTNLSHSQCSLKRRHVSIWNLIPKQWLSDAYLDYKTSTYLVNCRRKNRLCVNKKTGNCGNLGNTLAVTSSHSTIAKLNMSAFWSYCWWFITLWTKKMYISLGLTFEVDISLQNIHKKKLQYKIRQKYLQQEAWVHWKKLMLLGVPHC